MEFTGQSDEPIGDNWVPLMLRTVHENGENCFHSSMRVSPDGRMSDISDCVPPASQNTDRPEYSPKQGLLVTKSLFSELSLRAVALSSILADCSNYPDDIYREATNY